MKISYLKCNEVEPDIKIESEVDLNEQITEQDERDLLTVHYVHQIIQSYASRFNVIIHNCSYNITCSNKNELKFDLVVEGHPKFIAMLMITAHTAIAKHTEIDLDLFHGTITTSWDDKESVIDFKAEAIENPVSNRKIQH